MENWYELDNDEVLKKLDLEDDSGLSARDIEARQKKYGRNEFPQPKKDGLWKTILHQLKDITTLILVFAAVLSFMLALRDGEGFIEPAVIISIVIMNMILAITQEGKAERALEALANLNSPSCTVYRDGVRMEINTSDVVPGDIILLEPGGLVPADARILECSSLAVDESALTGESEPSEKDANARLSGKVALGDQINMVFSGCLVASGRGTAVVVATGMGTQMGRIAGFLNTSQKIRTPLQIRLDKVGKGITGIAIVSALFLFGIGIRQGGDLWSMALLAVSLAVAAVPETLSLIVTLSLSHGVKNMVKKHVLIRKLPAVETLGNTSVICSDKTGTLTQNRMTIKRLWMKDGDPFHEDGVFSSPQLEFLKMLALASNATANEAADGSFSFLGNPTEVAIMRLLTDKGIRKATVEAQYPKVAEIPFSSERKMMTVVLEHPDGGYLVLTKGAIDRLPFNSAAEETTLITETHDSFAKDAMRIIAIGSRRIATLPPENELGKLEYGLDFMGIIGLIDPPRPEVAQSIATAKRAGIRTIMITGDHAVTAEAIARDIGILTSGQKVLTGAQLSEMSDDELCGTIREYSVYARVSPEDKIRIVEAWQEHNQVVAMTGDGVNDAPALKAADVGVAMGKAGTEVAKSASDMVLTDDNFSSIVEAVHEGRNVYSNLRKTLYFLLVCNFSEIIIVLFAQIAGWGMIVTPIMLLIVNVLGDGIPGLHLAKETSDPRIMEADPVQRNESFFGGILLPAIIWQTLACSVVVLVAYYIGAFVEFKSDLGPSHEIGQTLAFTVLGWTSILHIFTVRSRESIFKKPLWNNPLLATSAFGMVLIFAFMVSFQPIGSALGFTAMNGYHWLIALGLTVVPTIVAEINKLIDNHTQLRAYRKRIVHHMHTEEI